MIRKDDPTDHADNLTQRELRRRELEREAIEERRFAELVRSDWGQVVMRQHR